MNTYVPGHHGEMVKIILEPAWPQTLHPTITNSMAVDHLRNPSKPVSSSENEEDMLALQDCCDDQVIYMLRV